MNKKGNTMIIGLVVVIAVLGVGLYILKGQKPKETAIPTDATVKKNVDMIGEENVLMKENGNRVFAGRSSPYIEFNKADYEKALAENKIVFLDFYANWCPICRGEAPDIVAGFNELTTNQVVGFRVNYNDSETDEDEKALAKEFDIPYQHHKVILKNGQKVLKDGEVWDRQRFLEEINKTL